MFSEIISLSDSLIITVFSMLLVFAALVALSFLLDGFRLISNREEKKTKQVAPAPAEANKQLSQVAVEELANQEDDLELVAVITASIAAMLSKPASSIVVRNIVRVPQTTPVWGSVARQEMINR